MFCINDLDLEFKDKEFKISEWDLGSRNCMCEVFVVGVGVVYVREIGRRFGVRV